MHLVFNELSTIPLNSDLAVAGIRVAQFLKAFATMGSAGYNLIRSPFYLHEIELTNGYSLQDWLNSPGSRLHKDLLLAAFRYPFIEEGDEPREEEYLSYNYFFEDAGNKIPRQRCQGLAAAQIYPTLSISFSNSPAWERNILSMQRILDVEGTSEDLEITNIFSEACVTTDRVRIFIENAANLTLVESPTNPAKKPIHFREDHGNDILRPFANRLVNCPYVTGVINSIEWKPRCPRFILRSFEDGVIHVVLHWDDRGIGMAIQTTGRNLRETEAIAEILQANYDS